MIFSAKKTDEAALIRLRAAIERFSHAATPNEKQLAFNDVCQCSYEFVALCDDSEDDHCASINFARAAIKKATGIITDLNFRNLTQQDC